ncbi:MAG: serine/threonine protein phosphatase [Rhodospirillaceae bacterium]|jgi:serine/threonine protein phosphatase 1|nr:serine/threonine protein phosphatase [Rhodospirillaceae bacterium]MBT4219517.1 serine/threonine protein phosphatase [Rhodospirillaceae bacterium]MBT4463201.1 serine/threonine protein phosphatase [Rhodospirillaceae bacterium]MBT5014008.1 serine/threonine protein phosphatase [Rhodospirillaceae bacterium]MBT5309632.1 serine/threonine protein phosphatase [Rhodospirillaceae bacterium]
MTATQHNKPHPTVPDGRRIYAIGDIHGRLDLLIRLLGLITDDADRRPGPDNVLVFLGDYIDRGPDSRGVLNVLSGPMPDGFSGIFLKGNHEDMVLQFLDGADPSGMFLANGGDATLESFGTSAVGTIPDEHLRFINGLQLSHVEGDYIFVHAGLRPGIKIEDQTETDMMWIRDRFTLSKMTFEKMVIHGHTINTKPQIRNNRIGIDTGAWKTGVLTCLVLEGEERRFLST